MRRALQWYGSRTVPGHFLKNLQPPLCKNLMLLHVLQHFLILHFLAWQASSSSLLFGWTLELSWRFGASEFWLWDLTQFLPCFSFPFLCHIKAGLGWNKNDALERYFFFEWKPVWMMPDIFFKLWNWRDLQPCNFSFNIMRECGKNKEFSCTPLECFLSFRSNVKSWWWEDWK